MATAFRTLLQAQLHGVARGAVEQALRSLEESVLQNIEDFELQQITNTLHAMAKARYTPTNPLVLDVLEQQAEAVAGTMNAQGVANTLWANATMGREPGAGMMRVLEGRTEAVAGTMKAQEVNSTLWAYATMGREPGARLRCSLEERILQVVADLRCKVSPIRGGPSVSWGCHSRLRLRRVWQHSSIPLRRRCRTLWPLRLDAAALPRRTATPRALRASL